MMKIKIFNRAFTWVGFLLFVFSCYSFTSVVTNSLQEDDKFTMNKDRILERHNYYRTQLGIPPLSWSEELSDYAQEWADELAENCSMKHRTEDDYGENIYWSSNAVDEYKVVDKWAQEEKYFNHRTKMYQKGIGKKYGHYSQMIWAKTTKIGAAVANCDSGGQIWVCNYDPPGNYSGEKAY